MSKLWKLTDSNGRTLNNTQWGENVSHSATGKGTTLCSDGFIHAYCSKWIAVFMNPFHGFFKTPLLWEARGEIVLEEKDLKCGCKTLTTIKRHPLSVLTTEERIKIAIYSALLVCKEKSFVIWAENWISKKDRRASAATAYADVYAYADIYASYAAAASHAAAAATAAVASHAAAANTAAVATAAAANTAAAAVVAAAANIDFKLLPIIQKVLKQRKAGGAK